MSRRTTLEKAIGDILTREDEIIAAIHAGTGSALFSDAEIAVTNRLCLAFMHAVARASAKEIRSARAAIGTLREMTLATDDLIAAHVHANPAAVAMIKSGQETLFRLLTTSPRTTILCARLGELAKDVVRSALLAHFTDLRHQLEEDEGKVPRYAAGLADTIGKKVSKTLTKAYQQSADSVVTITGPTSAARCEQIREVALYLAQAPRGTSIHTACKRAFHPVNGGYGSAESLFIWCHRNEAKLMNYVNELRLQV